MGKIEEGHKDNNIRKDNSRRDDIVKEIIKELGQIVKALKPLNYEEFRRAKLRFTFERFMLQPERSKEQKTDEEMYKEVYDALSFLGKKGEKKQNKQSRKKEKERQPQIEENTKVRVAEENINLIMHILEINNYKSLGKDETLVLQLLHDIVECYQKLPYYSWKKADQMFKCLLKCTYKDNRILSLILDMAQSYNIVDLLDEIKELRKNAKVPYDKEKQVDAIIEKFEYIKQKGTEYKKIEQYIESVIGEARFYLELCKRAQAKDEVYIENYDCLEQCLENLFKIYREIETKTASAYRIEEVIRDIAQLDDVHINHKILCYIKDFELLNLIDIPENILNNGSYPDIIREQAKQVINKLSQKK